MRIMNNTMVSNDYRGIREIDNNFNNRFEKLMDKTYSNMQPLDNSQFSGKTHKVYMKSDDMLYSGGNGTGLSFYIKYAENYTKENPVVIAKGVDENGKEFEKNININDIDPKNATIVEMRALEAYLNVNKGNGLSSFSLSAGDMGLNDRRNFIDMFQKDINDMNLLGQRQISMFYLNNMNKYLDFFNGK